MGAKMSEQGFSFFVHLLRKMGSADEDNTWRKSSSRREPQNNHNHHNGGKWKRSGLHSTSSYGSYGVTTNSRLYSQTQVTSVAASTNDVSHFRRRNNNNNNYHHKGSAVASNNNNNSSKRWSRFPAHGPSSGLNNSGGSNNGSAEETIYEEMMSTMGRKHNNCGDEYGMGKKRKCGGGWRSLVGLYGIVMVVSTTCYWNSLSGDFVHDDLSAIKTNGDVTGKTSSGHVLEATSLWRVFLNDFWGKPMGDRTSHKSYRPFTILTFR